MKIALWVAGIALLAFLTWGIYEAGFYPAISPHPGGQLTFGKGTLYGRRLASGSWQASYDSISASADQSVLDLNGVHDGIVEKDGKPYLNVRAKHLVVNTTTHDFTGNGGVRVTSLLRDTPLRSFDADQIVWSNALQRLTVVGKVSLESGASEPLVVDGLTFDVKAGQLHLGTVVGAANFKNDGSAPTPEETESPLAVALVPASPTPTINAGAPSPLPVVATSPPTVAPLYVPRRGARTAYFFLPDASGAGAECFGC